MSDVLHLRYRIVQYAAAGYRRRDIAQLCGITTAVLRRHLVALGIVGEVEKREVVESRRERWTAHDGPQGGFEEAEVEL